MSIRNKKKKRKRNVIPFKQENKITYNAVMPNRQARRLGIMAVEPPKQEKPRTVSKVAILSQELQRAKELQKIITPPSMTYGEYMEYLKEKRQQLEEKKL